MESKLDTFKALVPAGAEYVVNDRPYVGPQILIPLGGDDFLSCIGELDAHAAAQATRTTLLTGEDPVQFPLIPGEVEVALVRGESVSNPLRHLPIERAAAVVRRALAGDRSDFKD